MIFRFLVILLFSFQISAAPTIVVLGDSLSAAYRMAPEYGWVNLLSEKLLQQYPDSKVVNMSVSGDTTADGIERVVGIKDYNPEILILALGGNDGLRGFPIQKIENNLQAIINIAKKYSPNIEVLLVGIKLPPNYGDKYTQSFYAIYKKVSQKNHIALVPFLIDKVAGNKALMLADGIHPNVEAQPLLLNNVWPYLENILTKGK